MVSNKTISVLQEGDRVAEAVYLLEEKQVRTTRSGKPYLSARLRDPSGAIEARLWELSPGIADQLEAGISVQVSGEVTSYRDQRQLRLEAITPHAADPQGFLPQSPRPAEEMGAELEATIDTVGNRWLQRLLRRVLQDDAAFRARYRQAPAAKLYHHACLGGLLEHSLGVAGLAEMVAARYPQIPRDLLVTLALLHDVGKADAYTWSTGLNLSDEGRLLDHVYLGTQRVESAIKEIAGFPQGLRRRILHAMLAHHGTEEMGSPVRPQTLEAVVLHLIDMLDARIRGFHDHVDRQAEAAPWTEWSKMFGARLYRGAGPDPAGASGPDEEEPPAWSGQQKLPF